MTLRIMFPPCSGQHLTVKLSHYLLPLFAKDLKIRVVSLMVLTHFVVRFLEMVT